jgi:hypothetical protein
MDRNTTIRKIVDHAAANGFSVYAVVPFRLEKEKYPGALVLSDKVKGELAIHDVWVKEDGSVAYLSGIYPRATSMERSVLEFTREVADASWRFED